MDPINIPPVMLPYIHIYIYIPYMDPMGWQTAKLICCLLRGITVGPAEETTGASNKGRAKPIICSSMDLEWECNEMLHKMYVIHGEFSIYLTSFDSEHRTSHIIPCILRTPSLSNNFS